MKTPRTIATLFLAVVGSMFFSSCRELSFPQAQPAGVTALKEIPSALRGEYRAADDNGKDADTLVVESWGYRFRDSKDKDFLGKGVLSDSLVIKYYDNYYFVNFRSGEQWVLRLIRQKPSGAIEILSVNVSEDDKGKAILKKLQKRMTVKEIKSKDDTFYQINPTRDQLMQLIREGYFSGPELPRIR